VAKGLDFGLAFFYRVLLPGALVGTLALPILHHAGPLFGSDLQLVENIGIAVAIGITLAALNQGIYAFYQGRTLWPTFVQNWAMRRAVGRLRTRYAEAVEAYEARADPAQQRRYDELTTLIRQGYPTAATGAPTVVAPTALGNILAAAHDYPMRRYGMSYAFYWRRLWLAIDKDARTEVDESWAPADCWMHIAGGTLMAGVAYLLVAILLPLRSWYLAWPLDLTRTITFGLVGVGLVIASYVPYRISLPMHIGNGELAKALFDLHRGKLAAIEEASEDEIARSRRVWNALQHGVRAQRVPSDPSAQQRDPVDLDSSEE
jgi:hypothetical protein